VFCLFYCIYVVSWFEAQNAWINLPTLSSWWTSKHSPSLLLSISEAGEQPPGIDYYHTYFFQLILSNNLKKQRNFHIFLRFAALSHFFIMNSAVCDMVFPNDYAFFSGWLILPKFMMEVEGSRQKKLLVEQLNPVECLDQKFL